MPRENADNPLGPRRPTFRPRRGAEHLDRWRAENGATVFEKVAMKQWRIILLAVGLLLASRELPATLGAPPLLPAPLSLDKSGKLVYAADARGDRVPDYS